MSKLVSLTMRNESSSKYDLQNKQLFESRLGINSSQKKNITPQISKLVHNSRTSYIDSSNTNYSINFNKLKKNPGRQLIDSSLMYKRNTINSPQNENNLKKLKKLYIGMPDFEKYMYKPYGKIVVKCSRNLYSQSQNITFSKKLSNSNSKIKKKDTSTISKMKNNYANYLYKKKKSFLPKYLRNKFFKLKMQFFDIKKPKEKKYFAIKKHNISHNAKTNVTNLSDFKKPELSFYKKNFNGGGKILNFSKDCIFSTHKNNRTNCDEGNKNMTMINKLEDIRSKMFIKLQNFHSLNDNRYLKKKSINNNKLKMSNTLKSKNISRKKEIVNESSLLNKDKSTKNTNSKNNNLLRNKIFYISRNNKRNNFEKNSNINIKKNKTNNSRITGCKFKINKIISEANITNGNNLIASKKYNKNKNNNINKLRNINKNNNTTNFSHNTESNSNFIQKDIYKFNHTNINNHNLDFNSYSIIKEKTIPDKFEKELDQIDLASEKNNDDDLFESEHLIQTKTKSENNEESGMLSMDEIEDIIFYNDMEKVYKKENFLFYINDYKFYMEKKKKYIEKIFFGNDTVKVKNNKYKKHYIENEIKNNYIVNNSSGKRGEYKSTIEMTPSTFSKNSKKNNGKMILKKRK